MAKHVMSRFINGSNLFKEYFHEATGNLICALISAIFLSFSLVIFLFSSTMPSDEYDVEATELLETYGALSLHAYWFWFWTFTCRFFDEVHYYWYLLLVYYVKKVLQRWLSQEKLELGNRVCCIISPITHVRPMCDSQSLILFTTPT